MLVNSCGWLQVMSCKTEKPSRNAVIRAALLSLVSATSANIIGAKPCRVPLRCCLPIPSNIPVALPSILLQLLAQPTQLLQTIACDMPSLSLLCTSLCSKEDNAMIAIKIGVYSLLKGNTRRACTGGGRRWSTRHRPLHQEEEIRSTRHICPCSYCCSESAEKSW